MSNDEMRVAIAEHFFRCFAFDNGSKTFGLIGLSKHRPPPGYKYHISDEIYCVHIPLLTLDWLHSVEKTLEPNIQWLEYLKQLGRVLHNNFDTTSTACEMSDAHATAEQRAEAFLKVKGLWKEGE